MKNKKKTIFSSLCTVIIYSIFLFSLSFVSSFAFFGGSNDIILLKSREDVVCEEAEALVTSFAIKDKAIYDWDEQKTAFESETKYVASAGRYYSFSFNDQTINFLETKSDVYDTYYSFLHVYCGTQGSWSSLKKENSIIVSKIAQSKLNVKIGDSLTLDNGLSFNVVGICDGMPNSSKKYSGNLFADVFDSFVFVSEGTLLCQESGYFNRIESKMTNKQFSLRFNRWYSLKKDYNFELNMSCVALKNKLGFCDTFSFNRKRFIYAFICTLMSSVLIISFSFFKKKTYALFNAVSSDWLNIANVMLYFVSWFLLAFATSKIVVPIDSTYLLFGNLNTYSFNSLIMLIGLIPLVFGYLRNGFRRIASDKKFDDMLYEVNI